MTLQELSRMTEASKIVEVAIAHGYKILRVPSDDPAEGAFIGWLVDPSGNKQTWSYDAGHVEEFAALLPHYPTNLNAMHEAEQTMTREQAMRYDAVLAMQQQEIVAGAWSSTWHVSPGRRFNAFLITLAEFST